MHTKKSIAAIENTSCRGRAKKDPDIASNDEYPIVPSLEVHGSPISVRTRRETEMQYIAHQVHEKRKVNTAQTLDDKPKRSVFKPDIS